MSDKPVYVDLSAVQAELHRREQLPDADRLLLLERNVVLLLDTCELLLYKLELLAEITRTLADQK